MFGIKSVLALKKNDCEPIFIEKKLWKTKIRSCNDETTDFQSRKIPKAGSNYICWSGIIMDSVLK